MNKRVPSMNAKRRCANCKKYFPKESFFRATQVHAYHSKDCWLESQKSTVKPVPKPKPRMIPNKAHISAHMRKSVRLRDKSCRYCGVNSDLHVHHIMYRSEGGPHAMWNLILLCQKHHDLVHSNKRKFQPLLRGYIWLYYFEGKRWLVPKIEKKYGKLVER